MKKNHDKLFMSSPIYMQKINSKKLSQAMTARLAVLAEVNLELKEKRSLENLPFLWVGLIEYYNNTDEIKYEIGKIDKKDGELEMRVFIPQENFTTLDFNNENLLKDYYRKLYHITFDKVYEEFCNKDKRVKFFD